MPADAACQVAVHLRPEDNVAVAARTLQPARNISSTAPSSVRDRRVGLGHKIAVRPIAKGEAVHKYGQIIGFASEDIAAGRSRPRPQCLRRRFRARLRLLPRLPAAARRRRPSRAISWATTAATAVYGTRNYIAIISTVNCSASTSKYISERFRADRSAQAISQRRRRRGRSRTRPAAPCSTTAPTTTNSTARWPASPSIPTSPPTSSSASAARPGRRSTWSRTRA